MKPNLISLTTVLAVLFVAAGCGRQPEAPAPEASVDAAQPLPRIVESNPQESHLGNLRMLTDGGENAEAYFS
ncbi:MAG: hypothetical protein OEV48_14325, partial [Acidobacteriota bacterium]|nr:hypothetical protein [Acidobacteriota bacterium]